MLVVQYLFSVAGVVLVVCCRCGPHCVLLVQFPFCVNVDVVWSLWSAGGAVLVVCWLSYSRCVLVV